MLGCRGLARDRRRRRNLDAVDHKEEVDLVRILVPLGKGLDT
jgi:hypothetical protein